MNMTGSELRQKYIPLACAGEISIREAAQRIGITSRSVSRLKARYLIEGNKAFINGHTGMKPKNKRFNETAQKKICDLYNTHWQDSNFQAFCDNLEIYHKIKISYTTLLRIMKQNGIQPPNPKKRKEPDKHPPRKEREKTGELIQLDASTFNWFFTKDIVTLHGAIDDATHRILALYFTLHECRLGYNEVMRQIFERYGIPLACYTDRHSSFVSNPRKKGKTQEECIDYAKQSKTHWNELFQTMHIESILAQTPQGKGRIERLWQTLQGRLPFLFRYKNITTIEEANTFLEEFIEQFNKRFAKPAANDESAFRKLPADRDKDYLLSIKFKKRTKTDGTFIFHGYKFRLLRKYAACKEFTLCLSEKNGIRALVQGTYYDVELMEPLCDVVGDPMPKVEKDLIERYLLSDLKKEAC